ncbi:MAG: nucleoside triphosphate pyrophosphohydrolase [candidate division KSB1 bacterium]|nr:nucleoside triphosphate pyrophosphohydrolase [candidate division KSB1 bacterium]MDZ7366934.1 nucleoside triphosphate pyrophosphohydrolase [candidate division KSB1 bacterium]MDZ7406102.1 nucleoside triphosphate pyrophosphohydrolase [candidate division KSB1 bacterium]
MPLAQQFLQLVEIMAKLRSPEGCPWDREQTHQSLRPYLLEETYEVLETIDQEKYGELQKELGDLLLQVIFHAQIAGEDGRFTIGDVIAEISGKLIRRHPHVFGDRKVNSAAEQKILWEHLKKAEGKNSVIDGIPVSLPALQRAQRLQQKAGTIGFEWENIEQVIQKFHSELAELEDARRSGDGNQIEDEFGDLLFALVNVGRWLDLNAEDALRRACEKFSRRFRYLEERLQTTGEDLNNMPMEKWEVLWDEAKQATT